MVFREVQFKRDFSLAFFVTMFAQAALFGSVWQIRNAGFNRSDSQGVQRTTWVSPPIASCFDRVFDGPELQAPTATGPFPLKIERYTVRAGDTLQTILGKKGIPKEVFSQIGVAFERSGISIGRFRKGEALDISYSHRGDVIALRKRITKDEVLTVSAEGGAFTPVLSRQQLLPGRRVVSGSIERSFSSAAAALSLPYPIVDQLVDLFSSRVDFRRDFRPGDTFSVIYSEHRDPDGFLSEIGGIEAASVKLGDRLYVTVRHIGKDGKSRYFDENGRTQDSSFLRYPVVFTRVSSVFSDARLHPILGKHRRHNGVDFAAPVGTPVRASGDGVVIFSGYGGESGKMVKLQHGARYSTAYLHLSSVSPRLKKGARVSKGEVIGAVGATGLATGPHLHFSFFDRGRYVDPLKVELPQALDRADLIPPGYLQAALREMESEHQKVQLAQNRKGPVL